MVRLFHFRREKRNPGYVQTYWLVGVWAWGYNVPNREASQTKNRRSEARYTLLGEVTYKNLIFDPPAFSA